MKHFDYYAVLAALKRSEIAELSRALSHHGGRYCWEAGKEPWVLTNADFGPADVRVSEVRHTKQRGLQVFGAEEGGPTVMVNIDDVCPGHISSITAELPEPDRLDHDINLQFITVWAVSKASETGIPFLRVFDKAREWADEFTAQEPERWPDGSGTDYESAIEKFCSSKWNDWRGML